jgi:hypothetical protein
MVGWTWLNWAWWTASAARGVAGTAVAVSVTCVASAGSGLSVDETDSRPVLTPSDVLLRESGWKADQHGARRARGELLTAAAVLTAGVQPDGAVAGELHGRRDVAGVGDREPVLLLGVDGRGAEVVGGRGCGHDDEHADAGQGDRVRSHVGELQLVRAPLARGENCTCAVHVVLALSGASSGQSSEMTEKSPGLAPTSCSHRPAGHGT